jgi:hypothetical protein
LAMGERPRTSGGMNDENPELNSPHTPNVQPNHDNGETCQGSSEKSSLDDSRPQELRTMERRSPFAGIRRKSPSHRLSTKR